MEVGCGIGTAAHSFIENGANYKGLDISFKSLEFNEETNKYKIKTVSSKHRPNTKSKSNIDRLLKSKKK